MVSNLTVKIGADIAGLQKELKKATGQLDGFSKGMNKIGGMIAGAFAIGGLVEFGRGMVNITAEFQKFQTVLTNTLGSKSAAQLAMSQIQEFAAKTPFQVDELTGSFVKLANQGFVPTIKELPSLGDIASAMGKSFDQLAEAIIDAQTGEFERLKEFGIRASKEGDRVTFTFKGVKTQVDFTADSIRKYILSLGQAEGVSGGMAMQSETLGGRLSNLEDAFGQLQLAMGQFITKGGFVVDFIEDLARVMQMAAGTFQGDKKLGIENIIKRLKELQSDEVVGSKRWIMLNDEILKAEGALRFIIAREEELAKTVKDTTPPIDDQARSVKELMDQWDRQNSIFAKKKGPETTGKTGTDFLAETGVLASWANISSTVQSGLSQMTGGLQINSNAWSNWVSTLKVEIRKAGEIFQKDLIPIVQSGLSGIGHAIGDAISGSARLGDSLLRAFGGILTQLGELLIAAGIGIEAFKKSLTTLNPVVAIGAGVALIAIGSAIAGSIKGLGSSAGSSSRSAAGTGGNTTSIGSLGSNGLEITLGGSWEIAGDKLVYIINRTNQLQTRTRG